MYNIAVLSGDGIGPEVMEQAIRILHIIEKKQNITINKTDALVGGIAIDKAGKALPDETIDLCEKSHAILFGSVGGPKWESLPPGEQPERGALLPLRKHFSLYANLRPAIIFNSLREASPLKERVLPKNFDILMVRELTGDIYFGEPKERKDNYALDTAIYYDYEIERIAHTAFKSARTRNKKVTSIDKANVLTSMVFWREKVIEVSKQYPDITLSHMYVDNAAMQLVVNPGQFDVMLCPNLFGDILSDEASMLTGSLGMLPSASLGVPRENAEVINGHSIQFGLFEPSGGSAPDIANQGIANPIAQILSAGMMLKYSFGLDAVYDAITTAVERTLDAGFRTADIFSEGCIRVSTEEMGLKIADALVLV